MMLLYASRLMPYQVFFYNVIERLGIDGYVNGIGKAIVWKQVKGLRLLQTGNVGFYIFHDGGRYYLRVNGIHGVIKNINTNSVYNIK